MNKIYIILLTVFFYANVYSQQAYFVDGYHGGIYGHYPVKWKTQFIVDQLAMHPDWRICMEIEPETWDTVRVQTPEAYLRFKEMATSNQVEFTNPTYAQPYCYNISGESIIRQFQYGIAKINKHFPEVDFVTYSVEEPCFTSCLPQILKQFGFKYAVLKCPNTCWVPSGAVLSPLLSLSAASPCMGSGARMSCAMPLATGSDCASLADAPFSRMAVMA